MQLTKNTSSYYPAHHCRRALLAFCLSGVCIIIATLTFPSGTLFVEKSPGTSSPSVADDKGRFLVRHLSGHEDSENATTTTSNTQMADDLPPTEFLGAADFPSSEDDGVMLGNHGSVNETRAARMQEVSHPQSTTGLTDTEGERSISKDVLHQLTRNNK